MRGSLLLCSVDIDNVALYCSRLGLGFSTSEETVEVTYDKLQDEKRDGYTFSDGTAPMRYSLAKKVRLKLQLSYTPSAFQTRIGGCKGVHSVWSDEFMKEQGFETLMVRDSMFKYESSYNMIEVLETSRPLPLHLNQQVHRPHTFLDASGMQVILLLSNLGVGDQVFMDLLRSTISKMDQMFTDENVAAEELNTMSAVDVQQLRSVRFRFTTELYHRYLMKALYMFNPPQSLKNNWIFRKRMRNLLEKSRVTLDIDKGRVLIGIMDESGTLEPNEVFIQISKHIENPRVNPTVITSQIVIIKNPAVHPGDARLFQGMDIPHLSYLVDVVVFPNHGDRPHPNELSGSDLDGDQYHCIWEPRLVPTLMKEAMDYTPAEREKVEEKIGKRHMIDHICNWISNDKLGTIDNTHLALADQKEEGVEDEVCLRLAEIHALAVDAPKTGKWQRVPPEIKEELRQYPDFMMKADKPSYPSSKVLGEMFRECRKFISDAASPPGTLPRVHMALEVKGYKSYMETAAELFESYNTELQDIMRMYGIETEEEIMSGQITTVYPRLRSEIDDVQECVKHLLKKVKKKYRTQFEKRIDSSGDRNEEMKKQAAAWYYVAYSRKHGQTYMQGAPA